MAFSSITKPSDHFNTKLYTGNGSTQSITGVGFQPDWTWIKYRGGTGGHNLFDAVRGATKRLRTNSTGAENTGADTLTAFDSDGFSLGADTTGDGVNISGYSNVSWNWLGANGTAANSDGSISSTVSANTTAGFSIVSWTGSGANATIGHGLGATPKMIIVKNRTDAINWQVYNSTVGNTKALFLDATNAPDTGSFYWNDTTPTSSVFSVGTYNGTNGSSDNMIAYCFAEKQGYSKFGSYLGNADANGTFIYTGFKPAFFMVKTTSTTDDWRMFDNERPGRNVIDDELKANTDGGEGTGDKMDFLSNGVKCRISTSVNASNTFIYMAFAEEPFAANDSGTGIPATAG
jgi:hypothetical protein|tara:strand:- start:782 stop:1822 length:1041 start_codon:yes stop_codon:yes gene_type:complete